MTPDFRFGGWTGPTGWGQAGIWEGDQLSGHGVLRQQGCLWASR